MCHGEVDSGNWQSLNIGQIVMDEKHVRSVEKQLWIKATAQACNLNEDRHVRPPVIWQQFARGNY